MSEHAELFGRAALVARDPTRFEMLGVLSQDEKDGAFDFDLSIGDGLGANDQRLLRTLYQDAKTAYVAYQE